LLIIGAAAFVVALGSYAIFALTRPTWWTLYAVDLHVYADGGLIVRHVRPQYNPHLSFPLYDWPPSNVALKFTYTPFAALVFAVVSFIPWSILPKVSVVINEAAILAAVWFTLGGLGYRSRDRVRIGATLLGAAAAVWLEPVVRTLYLGQINLVLMAVIIWDLCQRDTANSKWWKGVATGFAAGIKLVPLIFIPYLVLTRKFREAAMATGAFILTVMLGFLFLPDDSRQFWMHGLFYQDGRTGFVGWGGNQSLRGLITRLAGSINGGTAPWLILAVIVVIVGLACAALLERAGYPVVGLLMAALTGLLVSPISWDHHWVWIVPGMVVAAHYGVRAWQAGNARRACGLGLVVLAILLVYWSWPGGLWSAETYGAGGFTLGLIWAGPNSTVVYYERHGDQPWFLEYHWHTLQMLAGNAYILGGLAMFALLIGVTAATSYAAGLNLLSLLRRPAHRASRLDVAKDPVTA
jgi:alpha-1,2-mannosyltransferase